MSSLTVEEDQKWVPTHVQVTVLRGRGLRGKGKHGTSDVYTIIQLGKEKYSTGVVEKTTEPEWREECSFELQPGVLENGGRCAYPAGSNELILTVMHRALMGLDMFLGQAVIQLDKVFHETRYVRNEWYRLNSKTGKKEKERGDIQVTVQFTRNNLTASMYDLVMKEKSASTFGKLKERMRGKRRSSNDDSSSAVLPSGYGSLQKIRQRLPSDGGGEEDYEDDEGGEARRSKMRTFFLRGKLRKSSDTRSSTSLGSESSESSSRGGSLSPTAGISVVVSDLSNSPSNSSNLTVDNSPEHTANTSPRSCSLHCEFGDEAGEISIAVPQQTVSVNGSHAYDVQPLDPGSGNPVDSLGLGLLQKSLPVSVSLQNLSPHTLTVHPKSPVGDGRRWSFDKPGEEEKAAIAAALEKSGPMLADEEDERSGQASSFSTAALESQGKKQRRNLFSHGRSESAGKGQSQSRDESEHAAAAAATEEKHGGWFGSKDSHSKPSLVVSPTLEPSTDLHPPPLPTRHRPPVDPPSLVSPLHHTNPFSHSRPTSRPMSPCNPFFSLVQHNPFYDDILTAQPLKPSLPPLPYLSSSRPPISQLFPQANNPHDTPTAHDSTGGTDPKSKVEKRPLPPVPTDGEKPLNKKSANPFTSAGEPDPEWDESFEAFAAGRLQSPEDPTSDCNTQQNTPSDRPLERCDDKGALLPTNGNEALHHQPCTEFVFEAQKAAGQVANTNTPHFDSFAQFLETIPEHTSFESDKRTLNALPASAETNQANSTTNTAELKDSSMHQPLSRACSVKLTSSSPDPCSSGLGSSAEEDFLSCLSSYSDKFSASSSEETESSVLGFEKSPESAVVKDLQPSRSEDDTADKSVELSSADDVTLHTVIQGGEACEEVDVVGLDGSQTPALVHPRPVIAAKETGAEGGETEAPKQSELTPSSDCCFLAGSDMNGLDGSLDARFSAVTRQRHATPEKAEAEESLGKKLRPTADVSSRSNKDILGEFSESVEVVLPDSPGCERDVFDSTTSKTPDHDLDSARPLLRIVTSSPDPSSAEPPASGRRDATQQSPIHFGLLVDFLSTSNVAINSSRGVDETLFHTPASDRSSFLHSLYVSTDSQAYQTCVSEPAEPDETVDSVNLTLRGDLSESQATAEGDARDPSSEETSRNDQSFLGASEQTRRESKQLTESQRVVLDAAVLNAQTLQRSHSEGDLTSAFEELLLPSFGSDPGAVQVQDPSSAQPRPALPSLASFPPSLTPDRRSSPVALFSLPSLADASASLPTGTSTPKPVLLETSRQQQAGYPEENSPHPVKPLTTAMLAEEKRTEGRSVLATGLEKLKSTIHPGRSSHVSEPEPERKKSLTEGAGSYYHLTHSELVALLVQRETDLERQKAEFERQKFLLAKRELELKKLKPQVKDLEDYIDTLLVRIMEQKPTLLQVRSKLK